MRENHTFRCRLVNIGKEVKVVYWSQKVCRSDDFLLRSTENSGGHGNSLFATGANAFRTTNFRSRLAMRGVEFHGNTGPDSTTRILSIGNLMISFISPKILIVCLNI